MSTRSLAVAERSTTPRCRLSRNPPGGGTIAVDERERHELHERLVQTLGPEPAGTLMSYLPPVGWADVATKQDLAAAETATRQDLAALESRIEAMLHRELHSLQRTVLFGMFTIVLTVAVMAFGAAQLAA